jgi:hypothetical protein
MSAVSRCEAGNSSFPVLLNSFPQIVRHSGVQAARPAGKNVDAIVAIHCTVQEWTEPSRETARREDYRSAFLSFALSFTLSSRTASCVDALRDLLFYFSAFAFFFTLSSRTASCADALRDLLFAFTLPTSSPPSSFQITPKALWKFPASTSASPIIPAPLCG